jgi:hypothetical protein
MSRDVWYGFDVQVTYVFTNSIKVLIDASIEQSSSARPSTVPRAMVATNGT